MHIFFGLKQGFCVGWFTVKKPFAQPLKQGFCVGWFTVKKPFAQPLHQLQFTSIYTKHYFKININSHFIKIGFIRAAQ